MIKVGDMVVCVDDRTDLRWKMPLVKGCVYTVEGFERIEWGKGPDGQVLDGDTAVVLEEVKNPHAHLSWCFGFWIGRFRPVKKTDISQFTEMLKERETEDAV